MRSIAFTGIDGSGKSTAISEVARAIQDHGSRVRIIWLRWRAFFMYVVYAYGRITGLRVLRPNEKLRKIVRSNEFYRNAALRFIYPWTQLFDMLMFYLLLRLRLIFEKPSVVLYDRFLLDTLIDISHIIGRPSFLNSMIGRIFLTFSRRLDLIILFDLDPSLAYKRERRGDVLSESELIEKRTLYLKATQQLGNVMRVDAGQESDEVFRQIFQRCNGFL